MAHDYARYKALKFNRPEARILEVILSSPGRLNALDEDGHRELAEVWRDIDRDEETSVVLLRGEGGNYSAGGDLKLVEKMADDWLRLAGPHLRCLAGTGIHELFRPRSARRACLAEGKAQTRLRPRLSVLG